MFWGGHDSGYREHCLYCSEEDILYDREHGSGYREHTVYTATKK